MSNERVDNNTDRASDNDSVVRRRFLLKGAFIGAALLTGGTALAQEPVRRRAVPAQRPVQVTRRRTRRRISRRAGASIRIHGRRERLRAGDPKLRGLELLIGSILIDPDLTERLFREPRKVAEAVNIELTDEEVRRIQSLPRESRRKIEKWSGEFQATFIESLRAHKTDINYLGDHELETLHQDLLGTQLATWHYHWTPDQEQLGFIIDDAPSSAALTADGKKVDLYRYLSMATASLQVQAKEIDSLKADVARLTELLERKASQD